MLKVFSRLLVIGLLLLCLVPVILTGLGFVIQAVLDVVPQLRASRSRNRVIAGSSLGLYALGATGPRDTGYRLLRLCSRAQYAIRV